MKPFTLIIDWDRLRLGNFPEKELKECDSELQISYEKISSFKQKITLTSTIPDEEYINLICFELVSLVGTIKANKI